MNTNQLKKLLVLSLGCAGGVDAGLNNILVDSYEVGSQNWTQKMEGEFQKRRGYSIRPYLPHYTFSKRMLANCAAKRYLTRN